ncbi:unnamed protein product [Clonostachys rosea]|uniref:NAD(P)-binding domain-containing protein n=1 Tax=Bionectria ochroleuca TaxID=29856 RepID=A0ABY6UX12_BIOOC|nr:unnamed protein product [Clonostachys rosea]
MGLKIFLTGATGYIGGTALAYLAKSHPGYEFTLLVRSEEKGKPIKAKYPNAKLLYGGLTDSAVVEQAAAEADVVVHTADSSDNAPGAQAIAKGLARGHSAEKPGYWVHVSGTSILTWFDRQEKRFGEGPVPNQKYHDIDDIDRIVTLPDEAHHRDVDKIVQSAISDAVKVAILCPPTIYGKGSGPVNTRSVQIPNMARIGLKNGVVPIVGAGKTEWDHVHIDDLGDLFVRLVDATQDPSLAGNPEVFGLHGYFFAESGSHRWADVAGWIAEEASRQGFVREARTGSVTQSEVELLEGVSTGSYGQNSKSVAQRAGRYLGWRPKGGSLRDEVARAVSEEAAALGLAPKEKA